MKKIKCSSCNRKIDPNLLYDYFFRKGNRDYCWKLCQYCQNAKSRGYVFFHKFKRWINPEFVEAWVDAHGPLNPNKLTIKQLVRTPLSYGYVREGDKYVIPKIPKPKKILQPTPEERKKITNKYGRKRFNPLLKQKIETSPDWWGTNDDIYRDEDFSTLIK